MEAYSLQLQTLKELFQDWAEDDLLAVLNDYNGNLELIVQRISQGYVKPFSKVVHHKQHVSNKKNEENIKDNGNVRRNRDTSKRGRGAANKSFNNRNSNNNKRSDYSKKNTVNEVKKPNYKNDSRASEGSASASGWSTEAVKESEASSSWEADPKETESVVWATNESKASSWPVENSEPKENLAAEKSSWNIEPEATRKTESNESSANWNNKSWKSEKIDQPETINTSSSFLEGENSTNLSNVSLRFGSLGLEEDSKSSFIPTSIQQKKTISKKSSTGSQTLMESGYSFPNYSSVATQTTNEGFPFPFDPSYYYFMQQQFNPNSYMYPPQFKKFEDATEYSKMYPPQVPPPHPHYPIPSFLPKSVPPPRATNNASPSYDMKYASGANPQMFQQQPPFPMMYPPSVHPMGFVPQVNPRHVWDNQNKSE